MNPDFTFAEDSRPVKGGKEVFIRIRYKGDCIANVLQHFVPSDKPPKKGEVKKDPIDYTLKDDYMSPKQHVAVFGYMAEHRRQWNNGNKINWTEELRVDINQSEEQKREEQQKQSGIAGFFTGVEAPKLPDVLGAVADIASTAVDVAVRMKMAGADAASSTIEVCGDAASSAAETVGDVCGAVADGVGAVAEGVGEVISGIGDAL